MSVGRVCGVLCAVLFACGRPPEQGAAPERAARARYGALMVECGYHFQVLGRAAAAGRWELASFEAKELTEIFAEDLEAAAPPQDAVVEVLLSRNRGFLDGVLPPLVSALKARDPARFAEAHRATVEACNGCHAQAGYEFIEIAPEPGAAFPRTD